MMCPKPSYTSTAAAKVHCIDRQPRRSSKYKVKWKKKKNTMLAIIMLSSYPRNNRMFFNNFVGYNQTQATWYNNKTIIVMVVVVVILNIMSYQCTHRHTHMPWHMCIGSACTSNVNHQRFLGYATPYGVHVWVYDAWS